MTAEVKEKKLKATKLSVERYGRGIKCTSYTLVGLGCTGVLASLYYQFTAKDHAARMIAGWRA